MSRSFLTSSDHLDVASATVATVPMALSFWVKRDPAGLGVNQRYFTVGLSGSNNDQQFIFCGNPDNLQAVSRDASSAAFSKFQSESASASAWMQVSANFTSTTSRTLYWMGRKAPIDTASMVLATATAMRISGNLQATPAEFALGLIAHVALWNIALSDDDHLRLVERRPDKIQPANLVEYWPLTGNNSPEPSFGTSPHAMVVSGTTFSQDNPVFVGTPYYQGNADYF